MKSRITLHGATAVLIAVGVTCLTTTIWSLSSARAHPGLANESSTTKPPATKAIARIWHGRVQTAKADEYYVYLKDAGINKIEAIEGNLGAQVLRRTDGNTTEFTVISYWESVAAIKKFAGEDFEKAHFLPRDLEYLIEPEAKVKHFEVVYDGRK